MTIPNPEHLFEQAEQLVGSRQVGLRRAISSAYYAVFHSTVTSAADFAIGRGSRNSKHYALAYRSIQHRGLRELCGEVQKTALAPRYRRYAPGGGFGPDIASFGSAVVELQNQRHIADYDPLRRYRQSDARAAIRLGRSALQRFGSAPRNEQDAFLSLLLFPPRS